VRREHVSHKVLLKGFFIVSESKKTTYCHKDALCTETVGPISRLQLFGAIFDSDTLVLSQHGIQFLSLESVRFHSRGLPKQSSLPFKKEMNIDKPPSVKCQNLSLEENQHKRDGGYKSI
jgi:hypothetical protein